MSLRVLKRVLGLGAVAALASCSAVERVKEIDGGPKIAPVSVPVARTTEH